MAACNFCGEKAGAFRDECKSCEEKRLSARKAEEAERVREREERERLRKEKRQRELDERTDAYVEAGISGMRQTLAEGRTPFLHTTLYLSTDFIINENAGGARPDLHDLDALGRDGWEVVATIPQTMGMGLTNVYKSGGQNWGGGIGGIVTGMYVIARMAVTEATLNGRDPMIREVLRSRYEDGRSQAVDGPKIPLLANGTDKTGSLVPLAAVAASVAAVSMAMDAIDTMDGGGGDDGGGFGDFDF